MGQIPVCLLLRLEFVKVRFYHIPVLFNLYMNDLANINPGGNRMCIILYADDILLIAPSVTMLENLLHKFTT